MNFNTNNYMKSYLKKKTTYSNQEGYKRYYQKYHSSTECEEEDIEYPNKCCDDVSCENNLKYEDEDLDCVNSKLTYLNKKQRLEDRKQHLMMMVGDICIINFENFEKFKKYSVSCDAFMGLFNFLIK